MFTKNNTYKVLKVFLYNPLKEFGLRQIARASKISPASAIKYLKQFEKENLIYVNKSETGPKYIANRDFEKFKFYQKISLQYELEKSGIIKYLWEKTSPQAIILFGSYSKGEATNESDIDIFLVGKKTDYNISDFEKNLPAEIQIFQEELKNIPKELKNNLINGIILKGYLKI